MVRWMIIFGLMLINGSVIASALKDKTVSLEDNAGKRLLLAEISFSSQGGQLSYDLHFNEEHFGDYFLSMRPFRCIDVGRLICRQPYPYALERILTEGNLKPLEYDLLFIARKQGDYGIDAYNGRYYSLEKTNTGYRGTIKAVDLNILAAPPDEGVTFPISEEDLDEIEPISVQFPKLIIE